MKKLSTLKKSLVIALSVASFSMASVSASQAATAMNEVTAASQSKISLEQALALANKAVKGDIISADFDQEDRNEIAITISKSLPTIMNKKSA